MENFALVLWGLFARIGGEFRKAPHVSVGAVFRMSASLLEVIRLEHKTHARRNFAANDFVGNYFFYFILNKSLHGTRAKRGIKPTPCHGFNERFRNFQKKIFFFEPKREFFKLDPRDFLQGFLAKGMKYNNRIKTV